MSSHPLIDHITKHLGPITGSWKGDGKVQVLPFRDRPAKGAVTYCTLGMSHAVLPMGRETIRQEVLIAVRASYPAEQVAPFLLAFAEAVVARDHALVDGEIIGPGPSLIPNVSACAVLVVKSPLGVVRTAPPIELLALVPLLEDEATLGRAQGADALEARLSAAVVDDLDRASTVLGT